MLTRVVSNWNSHTLLMEMQNDAADLETSLAFLMRLNGHLQCDEAIPLMGLSPGAIKMYVFTEA